jgi:acyl-CoA synthetase (NDP forming)
MVSFMGWEWVEKWREILSNAWILEYDYPKKAIRAFSRLIIQKQWKEKELEESINFELPSNVDELKNRLKDEKIFCSNDLTADILDSFWVNNKRDYLVEKLDDVEEVYSKFKSWVVVARINSVDIPHKSDVWGVILNIKSKEEAKKAYKTILDNVSKNEPKAIIKWVTFSEMIYRKDNTQDIFVWLKRDESFWDILIVWMWWIYVNVLEDVSRRIWLVSKKEIMIMLSELKAYPILKWVRGQLWINFDKLVNLIFNLQFIFNELTDIKEIDINPIFSDEKESVIVDAKFYL